MKELCSFPMVATASVWCWRMDLKRIPCTFVAAAVVLSVLGSMSGRSAFAEPFYAMPKESCDERLAAAEFFDNATSLLDQRRYAAALLAYEGAYHLCPRAAVLPNIAACLIALDRIADAANALSVYIASPTSSAAEKRERRGYLDRVRGRIAEIELVGDRNRGQLFIDGHPYSLRLPGRVFLEPGRHRITLESPRGKRSKGFVLVAGEHRRLALSWPRPNRWRGFARVDVVADDASRGAVFAPGVGFLVWPFVELRSGPLLSANLGFEMSVRVSVPIARLRIFADIGVPTLWVDRRRQSHARVAAGVSILTSRMAFSLSLGGARLLSPAAAGIRRYVSLVSLGLTVLR